jgi:hypothetical protein
VDGDAGADGEGGLVDPFAGLRCEPLACLAHQSAAAAAGSTTAALGVGGEQRLGEWTAEGECLTNGQDGGCRVTGAARIWAAAGEAKKWTWLQNAVRIEEHEPGVTMDTTAVAGWTVVTLSGSTVRCTGTPVP